MSAKRLKKKTKLRYYITKFNVYLMFIWCLFGIKEAKKCHQEKQNALKNYKKSKKKKFRNLCKKTKNGQILMGRQIDTLLDKIEKNNK